jgi:HAD superfamily hydrolase (TIGR01509 family)
MSPVPPSLVIFDLGNVLLRFDYRIAASRLAPHATASAEEILQLLLATPLLHRYECGELQTAEFFEAICQSTGFKAGFDVFTQAFTEIFTPIPEMIELHQQLRAARLPSILLSNTNDLQFQYIRKAFPFVTSFDHHVLSYEHHAMKPDAALYRVAESIASRTGPELVFLDDRLDNVEAAIALGWQAFVHQDPAQSRQRFVELGLLPRPEIG